MPNIGVTGEYKPQLNVGTLSINDTAVTATAAQLNTVGAAVGTVSYDRQPKTAKVALANVDTAGGVFAWANPEAGAIIITSVVIDVTTVATGACTLDIGTTATNATTSSNNLLTGLDVNAATGSFDNITDKGASGKSRQRLASGKWVTASKASGASAGLVGNAYITYLIV